MATVAEQSGNLDSYDELADLLAQLPLLMREARRARGLRMRDVGEQVGMSASTVCRIEAGGDCSLTGAISVLRWLGRPIELPEGSDRG